MSSDTIKTAQATPILAMKDVSQFLWETRDILRKQTRAKENKNAAEIVYLIEKILCEASCCIVSWLHVSNFYRRAFCVLEQAIPLLENGEQREAKDRMNQLRTAEHAIKQYVMDEINDIKERINQLPKLSDYGYNVI